jgi:hypothetical protein
LKRTLKVTAIQRFVAPPNNLHVLLRHRPRSISSGKAARNASEPKAFKEAFQARRLNEETIRGTTNPRALQGFLVMRAAGF